MNTTASSMEMGQNHDDFSTVAVDGSANSGEGKTASTNNGSTALASDRLQIFMADNSLTCVPHYTQHQMTQTAAIGVATNRIEDELKKFDQAFNNTGKANGQRT